MNRPSEVWCTCKGYDTHECAEPLTFMLPRRVINFSEGTGTAQDRLRLLAEEPLSDMSAVVWDQACGLLPSRGHSFSMRSPPSPLTTTNKKRRRTKRPIPEPH
ncbi:Alanine--tRNA ligase [Clarias magur]|uniref:Alanine--tRNA ligase n=1 Tax=Clarias magur TaxID=1594786 RepID=A0A8J4UK67_CLAMG|nr:Alanine--tRNA ligase [Clarias magur]